MVMAVSVTLTCRGSLHGSVSHPDMSGVTAGGYGSVSHPGQEGGGYGSVTCQGSVTLTCQGVTGGGYGSVSHPDMSGGHCVVAMAVSVTLTCQGSLLVVMAWQCQSP